MAQQVFGPAAVVSVLNRAFTNTSPSNAVFNNQVATAGVTDASQLAFAKSFGASFAAGKTAADLSALLMTNLGLDNAALSTALTDYIAANGTQNVGVIAWQLSSILSNLENDATYGAAAKAWNAEVTGAYEYSSNAKNTTSSSGSTTGNEAGTSTVLTTAQDVVTGSAGNDFFRSVAGVQVGSQDQTTLNSSDIIDGGAGNDAMIVNMTGARYQGGARLKSIETLQVGTNLTTGATFDYNVNQGFNEISDVTKIVYDQINMGETLSLINILKTDANLPTIAWVNEAGSAAGTANVGYRASAVLGATNQNVELSNVNAVNLDATTGRLNIAAGVETLTIDNVSAGKNTLNNSTFQPAANAAGVDLVSGTAGLTKVVVTGAGAFGEDANVVAEIADGNFGLTNRAVNGANDLGLSNNRTSASNLVSLANTVLEYDASAATGSQAVRFTPNITANTGVNVTFKGGSAADYAEFELGNINYNGGAGDDIAAFVNTGANSTFGEGDSMVGGDGADTIQLGLNGAGTYNVSETELRNKSSFGTLDLRGNVTNLTLSSEFVAAADTADSIAIRTDKIVQSSDTVATNSLVVPTNNGLENASTHTVNLTKLGSGQSVNFMGGSGSDRIILNDATFNVLKTLDGGAIEGQVTAAGNNRFDTITVVTNGENVVIDAQDLSNVKNFEGFVLTKNANQANYNITLTRAFITANTLATDDATTTTAYNDTVFQIGTSNAANNNALQGAADTVVINVADLLDAANAVRAPGFAGRSFDITSLENAGVNVTFVGNSGAAVTAATLRGLGILQANGAVVTFGDVVDLSAANPTGAGLFFQGTVADESVTLIAAGNSVDMGGGTDTVTIGALAVTGNLNGGAGTDTIVFGAGGNIAGATVTNFEAFTLGGAGSMTAAQHNAFTAGANAGSGGDVLTLTTAGTVTADADIETYNLAVGTNQITLAGTAVQAINGNTGDDTVVASGANTANKTIALGTGSDTLTISTAFAADWSLAAAGAAGAAVTGVETVNLQGGLATGAAALTMFNGAATVNLTSVAGQLAGEIILGTSGQTVNVLGTTSGTYTITGAAGQDAVNLSGVGAAGGVVTIVEGAGTSLVTNFTTITGFRAGVDKLDAAVAGAGQLTTLNVNASVSLADLAGTLSNAVNQAITLAVGNWNAAGDTVIVNISAGTAAGTYLAVNAAADATFDAAAEMVVKLVGTVGTITLADIV